MDMIADSTKLELQSERTRQAVLQAALDEFSIRGFEGTTTRGIANRAGFSHGLIRHYFKSKENLWYEAVDHLFKQLDAEVLKSPEWIQQIITGDRVAVHEFIRSYVRYCAKHPEHTRILYHEAALKSERLRHIVEHDKLNYSLTLFVIQRLMEIGKMRKSEHPISIMFAFFAVSQNFFAFADVIKISMGYDVLTEEAIEAHATVVLDLFYPDIPVSGLGSRLLKPVDVTLNCRPVLDKELGFGLSTASKAKPRV